MRRWTTTRAGRAPLLSAIGAACTAAATVAWAQNESAPLAPYQPPSAGTAQTPTPQEPPPLPAPPNLRWVLVDPVTLQPAPEPGFHRHDGFFMRALVGVAVGEMRGDLAAGQLRISGRGLCEAFAFGGAIRENLILYGEYSLEGLFESDASGSGQAQAASGLIGPMVLTFAPGVAYYLQPRNLYVSAAVGLAFTLLSEKLASDAKVEHDSAPGIGGSLSFGKEWWTSANWGLGFAIRASFASMRERVAHHLWLYYSAAVLFSATYN